MEFPRHPLVERVSSLPAIFFLISLIFLKQIVHLKPIAFLERSRASTIHRWMRYCCTGPTGERVSSLPWPFCWFSAWQHTHGGSISHQHATHLSSKPVSLITLIPLYSILTSAFTSMSPSSPPPAKLAENIPQLMHHLWKPFLHDINTTDFLTKEGYYYKYPKDTHHWSQPLRKKLLILDVDTRLDTGPGGIMNKTTLNSKGMTGRTAGMMNHYLYGIYCLHCVCGKEFSWLFSF